MAATVADAKGYLRIEGNEEDALIGSLIATATALCEQFIGQWLVERGGTDTIMTSGGWVRLRAAPVRTIVAVRALPRTGLPYDLPVEDYAIDIDPGGDGWVRVIRGGDGGRALVTFTAGMAVEAAALPPPLVQGILRLVAHLHAHRDDAGEGGPPAAVAALWRPWRRMRLR